ncbi:hypothetical protein [Oscillatoria sp. HE19RPO]|uniref:hypothetical protein n=1 Tax=Oscillatoria sp. HE19RPO TaxID=2954806 RepID=UPI0020C2C326|nr:hypothetical protein [Oscillatoria sp. HE19RPO]
MGQNLQFSSGDLISSVAIATLNTRFQSGNRVCDRAQSPPGLELSTQLRDRLGNGC